MIADVTFEDHLPRPADPFLKAGTGNIADAPWSLGAAIDYVERIGLENRPLQA